MSQIITVDVPLGPARSGLAIGCIVYQLDGSTVVSTFDVTGWYEAPAGTGEWHHPGVVGPDVGGVIAVGISGTEYKRAAFPAALNFATPTNVSDAQTAITAAIASLNNLSSAQAQSAASAALTAYGTATGANVSTAQSAITIAIAALHNLSTGDIDARLAVYDGATQADLNTAQSAIIAAQPSASSVVAALMAYVLESGKTVKEAWLDIWSVTVGDGEADDANNPTQETYKSPDGTIQVTHAQTATTRTNV